MSKTDLRRNQIVVPFGVGAIYNYKDYSAITMSVDDWPLSGKQKKKLEIQNRRFITYINIILKAIEGDSFKRVEHLIMPPLALAEHASEEEKEIMQPIPVRKFPQWGVCTRCSALSRFDPISARKKCRNSSVPPWMINQSSCSMIGSGAGEIEASRFIAVCTNGHITDFPYLTFMSEYCTNDSCNLSESSHSNSNPTLYFSDDTKGFGFGSLKIHCSSCQTNKTLKGINNFEKRKGMTSKMGEPLFKCTGHKPWTSETNDECNELLEIVPRAASKIYLSDNRSAIFIPEAEATDHPVLLEHVVNIWIDENTPIDIMKNDIQRQGLDKLYDLNGNEIVEIIENHKKHLLELAEIEHIDDITATDQFFKEEYIVLRKSVVDEERFKSREISIGRYGDFTVKHFEGLHQITKLITTTSLLGFTRATGSIKKFCPARVEANYLPAVEVSGEGIFINFGFEKVQKWSSENPFTSELEQLKKNSSSNPERLTKNANSFNYSFLMLHTFAHALMQQLSFECGYALTEIKERIYFSEAEKMAGVLIYTSSSDSAGSLGGLVRMIKPEYFENLLQNAIENSYTCFNDPICIDSQGQGLSGLCLASCYACSMIPDLSCGVFPQNTFLDRNALIGSKNGSKGYFTSD